MDRPIGCVFLNKPTNLLAGGVASLGGGQPFTFTNLETLAGAADKWVISMPEPTFLTEQCSRYPFLRHAGFLATPISFLAQELGAFEMSKSAQAVQRISEVLTRTVAMAGLACPEALDILDADSSCTLVQALRTAAAPPLRREPIPVELQEAMPSLIKAPGPMAAPTSQDMVIRIPANRLRLSQAVLGAAVPAGAWNEVDLEKFPTVNGALSWAIGNQQPVIAQVTINKTLPNVKASAPLMRHLTNGATRWMALPEIIALTRIVEMTPRRMFVASELVPVDATLKVPGPVFSPAAIASISAGLLAEAFMHAVCSSSAEGGRQGTGELANPQVHAVRAAWLTGVARASMMQEAKALAEANFAVVSIGHSHVVVGANRKQLRLLRKAIAASSLLSYPTGLRALEEKAPAKVEPMDVYAASEVAK